MSKKLSAKRNGKKAQQPAIAATTAAVAITAAAESELSFDEMLSELEAIVSEAGSRLTEEETSL